MVSTDSSAWHTCWTPHSVNDTVFNDVALLPTEENALFLAAHTVLPFTKTTGRRTSHHDAGQAILEELEAAQGDKRRNTLIAVVGPSGCGKTHLVRWVNTNLDADNPHVCHVHVPKESNTLRSILLRILDQLPPSTKASEVRSALDTAFEQVSPEELRLGLLQALIRTLSFAPASDPTDSDGWTKEELKQREHILGLLNKSRQRTSGIGELLQVPAFGKHLARDGGPLDLIVDSLVGERSGGDEHLPEFDDSTFNVNKSDYDRYLSEDAALRRTWTAVFNHRQVLTRVLNEALPRATSLTLGLRSGQDIREVFHEARRMLKREDRELRLIFEDLAQLGSLDKEILDQFTYVGTELTPIRAVFAITSGKYIELENTVKTRVDHLYQMDQFDIYQPEQIELVETLTAKFLNLARLDKDRVLTAYAEASDAARRSGAWIPNKCLDVNGLGEECPHRQVCWDGFGEHDGIGLFPYNRTALGKALEHLRTKDDPEEATPRTIAKFVVANNLVDFHQDIRLHSFPSLETRQLFAHTRRLAPQDVTRGVAGSTEEINRLRRVREIWANEGVERSGIREWFALLEPTDEATVIPPPPPVAQSAEKTAGPTESTVRPNEDHAAVLAWADNEAPKPLPEKLGRRLREILYDATVDRARLSDYAIDGTKQLAKQFLQSFFVSTSFTFRTRADFAEHIADTGAVPSDEFEKFSLLRKDGYQILAGALWFTQFGHWDPAQGPSAGWTLSADALTANRGSYEAFIDECAERVRTRTLEELGTIGGPAEEVVRLRTLACRALGLVPPNVTPDAALGITLNANLVSPSDTNFDSSWRPVVHTASKLLEDLDVEWIRAFGTVAQSGRTPQAIDSQATQQGSNDGMSLGTNSAIPRPAYPPLRVASEPFLAALENALPDEGPRLSDLLMYVHDLLPEELRSQSVALNEFPLEELADVMLTVGTMAANANVFRPPDMYGQFSLDCSALKKIGRDQLAQWLSAAEDSRSGLDTSGVLALQSTAAGLEELSHQLRFLNSCLQETSAEAERRGGSGTQLARVTELQLEVGASVDELADLLGTDLGGVS